MKATDQFFTVEFKKRGKPHWIPGDKKTGRPGYWVPSYPRVYLYSPGTCVVFPEDIDDPAAAINSALDRAIECLQRLKRRK